MNERHSGIIIELFGTPGTGKSYLAKALSESFKANGMGISNRPMILAEMARNKRVYYKFSIIIPMLVTIIGYHEIHYFWPEQ